MNRIAAAACSVLSALSTPAAAQHEHHRVTALDTLTVRAERDAVQLRSGPRLGHFRCSEQTPIAIIPEARTSTRKIE
jgi:hypothetical protein